MLLGAPGLTTRSKKLLAVNRTESSHHCGPMFGPWKLAG